MRRRIKERLCSVRAKPTPRSEAFRVYADYVKNTSETNLAAYRGNAEYVKERVTEGAATARENLSKAFPRAA